MAISKAHFYSVKGIVAVGVAKVEMLAIKSVEHILCT